MEDTKACLISYVLDGTGNGKVIDLAMVTETDERLIWIHLNGRHPDARKFLKDQIRLDPLIVKSLLAEETRPRLEEFGSNALIILRGIQYNPGPAPEDLVSIRLFVTGNRIISVGRRKSKTISEVDERIKQGRGPRKTGEFVSQLLASLHDGIEPVLQEVEKTTDYLEEKSLDNPDASLRTDIALMRKQATLFRRHMAPQRDAVGRMISSGMQWITPPDKWYLQDSLDRITRFLEDLDSIRERTQILQDELTSALSSRLNKNLYILSAITVIFMPLTFITGLLGMNVEGIPGAHHPMAFTAVCALSAILIGIQIYIYSRLKWF